MQHVTPPPNSTSSPGAERFAWATLCALPVELEIAPRRPCTGVASTSGAAKATAASKNRGVDGCAMTLGVKGRTKHGLRPPSARFRTKLGPNGCGSRRMRRRVGAGRAHARTRACAYTLKASRHLTSGISGPPDLLGFVRIHTHRHVVTRKHTHTLPCAAPHCPALPCDAGQCPAAC